MCTGKGRCDWCLHVHFVSTWNIFQQLRLPRSDLYYDTVILWEPVVLVYSFTSQIWCTGASSSAKCAMCIPGTYSSASGDHLPHDIPCSTNLCWQADLMIGAIASTTCSLCDAGTYSSSSGKAYYYYSPFHFRKLAVRTMRTCIPLFFLKTFAHLLLAGSMASSLCTLCTAGTYSTASGFDLAFNKILCHTYFYFLA